MSKDQRELRPLLAATTAVDEYNSSDDSVAVHITTTTTVTTTAPTAAATISTTTTTTSSSSSGINHNKAKWSALLDKHDLNKNVLDLRNYEAAWAQVSLKYGNWSCRQLLMRRKAFLALLLLALFAFFVISALQGDEQNSLEAYVPVMHQSHVLGMKVSEKRVASKSPPAAIDSVASPAGTLVGKASVLNVAMPSSSSMAAALPAAVKFQKTDLPTPYYDFITEFAKNASVAASAADAVDAVSPPPKGYLVWSDQCKIQNTDPYMQEVMRYFKRIKYKPCASHKPLTTVQYNATSGRYVLSIVERLLPDYTGGKAYACCYNVIERLNETKVSLSACVDFKLRTQLAPGIDGLLVKCTVQKKQIYINGHALVAERAELRSRLQKWRQHDKAAKARAPSVLMIGIDSVSRLNLIRAMPKTAQYLYDNEWFEMSGYNKVDDNTFPNLMAVLAGLNKTSALHKCNPRVNGALDNCTFIWREFQEHGYVTAFAEDAVSINTFNYLKQGFQRPPVDYYLRPFLLAAEEHLKVSGKGGLVSCVGYKHAAEHIYDYALEFVRRYRNDSYFGFFWTNTFSHNDINDCTTMDDRVVDYLKHFGQLGAYNNSIVIFLSDHGIRFGPTRKTWSGHLEERLPFMFVWLPPYLKQTHPEFVNALSVNKNRLTNPFDLHMTLKHALTLSRRVDAVPMSQLRTPVADCPRCHSLLQPVAHNRSCQDIAIEDHWCTCIPYHSVYKNSKTITMLAHRVLVYINDYVAHFQNGTFAKRCRPLGLHSISSAYKAHHSTGHDDVETYRIVFYTSPNKGLFEATVRYNETDDTSQITGEISRLNMYSGEASCMDDFGAKKYCVCRRR